VSTVETDTVRATPWVKKSTFSRFLDQVVNNGELDLVDSIFHPDFVGQMPETDDLVLGPKGARQWAEDLRAGFSQLNTLIEGGWLIAEDDAHHVGRGAVAERVAAYVVIRGMHTGSYAGIPATGRRVMFSQIHLLRFDSGLIVDDRVVCDRLSLLQQLDLVSVPDRIAGPHLPAELI
jgi:hypothetical protein